MSQAIKTYFRPSVGAYDKELKLLVPTMQAGEGDWGIECYPWQQDINELLDNGEVQPKQGWYTSFIITSKNCMYRVAIRSAIDVNNRFYSEYLIEAEWNAMKEPDGSQATFVVDGKPQEPKPYPSRQSKQVAYEYNLWNTTPYQLVSSIRQKIASDSGPTSPGGDGNDPQPSPAPTNPQLVNV